MALSLQHTLVVFFFCSSAADFSKDITTSAKVGENVTVYCDPPPTPQDGVYLKKRLLDTQNVCYFYSGTLTPKGSYPGRLDSNKNIQKFSVTIINVNDRDTGVYWCVFNKEEVESNSVQRTLLVVSGKEKDCDSSETNQEKQILILIIMCVASAFVMLLITLILLCIIPKLKRCCERRNFSPTHRTPDGVYEEMRGRQSNASHAHTLVNPAYQSSTRHTNHLLKTESPHNNNNY